MNRSIRRIQAKRRTYASSRVRLGARGVLSIVVATAVTIGIAGSAAPAVVMDQSILDKLIPAGDPDPIAEIKELMAPTDPNKEPNLLNEKPALTGTDKLDVTVGRAVVVSSNPDGSSAGLTALVSKTQVSGKGQRTIKVPVATDTPSNSSGFDKLAVEGDSVVYNVNSTAEQVQTFNAGNGSYKEKLPVSVNVKAWVDGKEIAPADFVNVTGHVKVAYTFNNDTGVPTKLSYTNAKGQRVETTESIPIPYGGSFSVTLPPTFAAVNAPWASGAMSPSGLVMSGSVNLLGPIPVIGGTTQTLTFEARAQNASLPASTYQAVPVTLSDTTTKYGLEGGPIAQEIVQIGDRALSWADSELLKYHALFQGYVAQAEAINAKYVKPILEGFADGSYKKMLDGGLDQVVELDKGTQQLGSLLPAATEVIGYVAKAAELGVPLVEDNIGTLNTIVNQYETYLPKLIAMQPKIDQTITWLSDNADGYIDQAVNLANKVEPVCEKASDWDQTLGAMLDWLLGDGVGASVARAAINLILSPFGTSVAALKADLDSITPYVDDCVALLPTVVSSLKQLQQQLPTYIGYAQQAEKILQQALALAQKYNPQVLDVVNNQQEYLAMIDNNNCQKTPDDIKSCGYLQQIEFLDDMMNLASKEVNQKMVPGLDKVVDEYLPLVRKYFALATDKVNEYGPKAEAMLPEVIGYVESMFGKVEGYTGTAASYVDKAGDVIGKTVAAMQAMEARGQSGQGQPAGANAVGADTNLGVYQFSMAAAADSRTQNLQMLALAVLAAALSLGVGTLLHRRNR